MVLLALAFLGAASVLSAQAAASERGASKTTLVVVGDSIARHYCRGLRRHLRRDADIAVECWVHPSTGLTRDDVFDWSAALDDYLAKERVDLALISFGANDAQRMFAGDGMLSFGAAAWDDAYAARVDAVIRKFAEHGSEVVWVGLPIPRSQNFARRLARLNGIYENRIRATGETFLPLWDATQSADGGFSPDLPDPRGRRVLAREPDGVHFTRDGENLIACKLLADLSRAGLSGPLPDGC